MLKYWLFLKYLIRHKYYVFMECVHMGIAWRGVIHDLSKLIPGEFIAYARYYYENRICSQRTDDLIETDNSQYYITWLIHQKRNRHHWQWWVLHGDDDNNPQALPMADKYVKEMVADWRGAGRAQGEPDTIAWYQSHKGRMVLHPSTRIRVEQLLYAKPSPGLERGYQTWPMGKVYRGESQPGYAVEAKSTG